MLRAISNYLSVPLVCLAAVLLSACCENKSDKEPQLAKPSATISVSDKKSNFFAYLNPMIVKANNEVLAQRTKLLGMQSDLPELTDSQQKYLMELSKTYRVDNKLSPEQQISLLSRKINTIPASLILAQAANESAWGTSRFAREGNNYFGQWCFTKGCGIVPSSRNEGAGHEVASFDTPLDSIKSYIRNLNRHITYKGLRDLRAQALSQGQKPSGELLAKGLIGYSERGEEYVKEIQSMIRYNKLSRFDTGSIEKPAPSI
jgi:Bax protein